jgi:PAS domain-containing protein
MIVFDASRRVRLANAAFAELVGEPEDALAGRHFEELTEQSDRPATPRQCRSSRRSGRS